MYNLETYYTKENKQNIMKKIFLLLLSFIALNSFGQSKSFKALEGSFHHIEGCITIPAHTDQNDLPMAVIKIIPDNISEQERTRLTFEGNLATDIEVEQKVGETWVYVTAKAITFLRIKHPDFGVTELNIPMEIEPNNCYEMVLQYVEEPKNDSYVVIDSNPKGADMYIDGQHYGKTPDIIKELPIGKHELRLEKAEYNPITKIFIIKEGENLNFKETLSSIYVEEEQTVNEKVVVANNDNIETTTPISEVRKEKTKKVKTRNLNTNRKGFFVMPEIEVGSAGHLGLDAYKVNAIFGYEFNNHFSLGVATGFNSTRYKPYYDVLKIGTISNLPLYVNIHGDMFKGKTSLYYSLDLGFMLPLKKYFDDHYDYYYIGYEEYYYIVYEENYYKGLMISPEIGIKINKCYCGINLLIANYYHNSPHGNDESMVPIISIKFGYKIPLNIGK